MSDYSLDLVQNFQKEDAFDFYMQENISFYDYSQTYYNANDNMEHIVVYFTEPLNANRIEMITNLVSNFVDPAVFYAFRYSQSMPCSSEIIINDSDTKDFETMSLCYLDENRAGFIMNQLIVMVITDSYQSDFESQYDPAVALQLTDLSTDKVIALSGEIAPDGTTLTDGSTLTRIVFDNLNSPPASTSTWEIAGYVLGNISAKISGIKFSYYQPE